MAFGKLGLYQTEIRGQNEMTVERQDAPVSSPQTMSDAPQHPRLAALWGRIALRHFLHWLLEP